MKQIKSIGLLLILGAILLVVFDGVFIVNEQEQVVITQFGRPIDEAITEPGVHFKTPFIQTTNFFDKRYLEWDGDRNQVPTKDKKFIFVDTYARWQIVDPLQFFKRLRDETGAQSRLDDILDGETRNAVANNELSELIRTSNREVQSDDSLTDAVGDTLFPIEIGRERIQKVILEEANKRASDLGIAILDFRFKRINYVEEVREKVYERMISERNRIADKFRSEGQGEASRINGEKDRDLKKITSEAFRKAEEIRGKADAEAAAIYANAYNRNASSRSLYAFLRSMESYTKTFDSQTTIVLSTDSEFFRYLNGSN
jgi:membrane protease subunit HflC